MRDRRQIRNFSIIAHIDHGKSTLADRILELTHSVDPSRMREQVLDSMDLERERGITIKAQAVRVLYEARDGETYQLHLIDTPGHVDFTYEVSRSLAACEGALLVVDAFEELVAKVPPPSGDPDAPPRALIFDSEFDQYRGVVAYIRVVDGTFRKGEAIRAMAAGTEADIDDIGFFTPAMTSADELHAGEGGFLITGIKDVTKLRVGDTLTTKHRPASAPLPGYRDVKPMVFCGLFPIDSDDYPDLRDALEKLTLNDAALVWEPETSDALGFGFRIGFLGLLHMDIVRERLEREYGLDLIVTNPSTDYKIELTDDTEIDIK